MPAIAARAISQRAAVGPPPAPWPVFGSAEIALAEAGDGVGVPARAVGVWVGGTFDAVAVAVDVSVGVSVGVFVATAVFVGSSVGVLVAVAMAVAVAVAVTVGSTTVTVRQVPATVDGSATVQSETLNGFP